MVRTKTKTKSRTFSLYIILSVLLIAIVLFFVSGPRGTIQYIRSYREKQSLLNDIEALETRKESLIEQKKKLESDTEFIERKARETYTMKKKGEKVYKVVLKKKE